MYTFETLQSDKFTSANFHVVKSKGPTLLSLQTSRKLGLVTLNFTIGTKIAEQEQPSSMAATQPKPEDVKERERILKEFVDVFKGIGGAYQESTALRLTHQYPK